MTLDWTTFTNTIDGKPHTTAETRYSVNPATKEPNPPVPVSTKADLDLAVSAASKAFKGWAATPWKERKAALLQFGKAVTEEADGLAKMLVKEQGKPLNFAKGEVDGMEKYIEIMCAFELPDEVVQKDDQRTVVKRYLPLGVGGAIVPWNYPVALMVTKITHAVLTGNTIVCKPSPFTPYTGLKLVELAQRFFPPGVINAVSGDDNLGPWMTSHPGIHKISFTGSSATGRKVMESCSKTLKRVTLELGGKDPAIILPDVDIPLVASQIAVSSLLNSGQICIATKRIYVHSSIAKDFIPALVEAAKNLKVGDGMDDGVFMGPIQNEMQYEKVVGFVDDVKKEGGQIVLDGGKGDPNGFFVKPMIVVGPSDSSKIMVEEPFGPIVPVATWTTDEEVLARANDTNMGLGASVWGKDIERAERIARSLEAGSVWINEHMSLNPSAPFGGWKGSGLGVENGLDGLKGWCNVQVLYTKKQVDRGRLLSAVEMGLPKTQVRFNRLAQVPYPHEESWYPLYQVYAASQDVVARRRAAKHAAATHTHTRLNINSTRWAARLDCTPHRPLRCPRPMAADDDDYFGDDDDFNLDELQELENAAVLQSLTQKQKPPPIQQPIQPPQPPKNQYQISSRAAAPAAPAAPLSSDEEAIRAAFLARNQERQRLRQQQQDDYLAQQKQHEIQAGQQQAYLAEQRQVQLSQSAGYSHRQRQLQPRPSTRPTPSSYITQPTLPSSPLERVRVQNGATGRAPGTASRPAASNLNPTTNGAQYHTARSNAQAQTVGVARPEEYETYDAAEELWDTAAPTEVVLQEGAGTTALNTSALGTSEFGTSAWIPTAGIGTVAGVSNVTNDDMVDYDAVEHKLDESAAMEVDDGPKGLAADQLEELERLRKATQQLLTKSGENSILRKKMEKAEAQHRSEVDAIRSLAQQKHEKSEADMAKLRAEVVKMQATLEFDRNDQKEIHRELKHRLAAFRDGFDDDEAGVSMRSSPPVGPQVGRGRGTPSKSAKRKRKPTDSPMKASQTLMLPILKSGGNSQRSVAMDVGQQAEEDEYEAMIERLTLEDLGLGGDDRQQFLEAILSHKPEHGAHTILEVLEQYSLPSDEETSLAALFMENVPQADVDAAYGEFPARICCILIALWDRCYTEKFFEPLSLLLDFLHYVINQDFSTKLFHIIMEPFAEVLQKTVMLNSLERFKGHHDRINPLVDVEKCLHLFETVALGVLTDEELARHFWTLIQPDFIAPFMTWNQPLPHIRLILNTLPSSVFTNSYGPISPDPLQQKDYERITLIHASFLLTIEPKPASSTATTHPGLRRAEVLAIRTAILTFYTCIATTDHGINSLVTNANWQALSRVIVRTHHELEEILEDRHGLESSVAFVNNAVRFIHRVIKLQRANDDIERLLSGSTHNGNGHKHLVLFARIAFRREKGWLSSVGVRGDVVEMAMEVLECSVTMEQGDEIWGLFRGRPGGFGGEVSMTESMIEADKIMREVEMRR
ncbi:hypothetical protein Dda_7186 [Drechslerella dactyloides]|uniref:aldehyde dehydrogenase (NAD(+)) n=1 Tax=Drechslerella dactyloides TaxID=74499 RepID=A0AAD6IXL8_DREDA|nr:hypothetical protein Dda_7186 [Drechslerella dactyloides]